MRAKLLGLFAICAVSLGACGDSDRNLAGLFGSGSVSRGPDEFAIVPTKPLEIPQDLTNLPDPDLGGPNRVDLTPQADAVAALGGNPARLTPTGGVPAGEVALVNATGRNGSQPQIRATLAREDAEFRRRNGPRFFERLAGRTGYFRRYERQSISALNEQQRLRGAGVRAPAAPPDAATQ